MAIATGACPGCGAEVTFRAGASMALVCGHCKSLVVRTDRGLETPGRVADVVFSDTALAPGDQGAFMGRHFEVMGRVVLQHPAGGTWEEYYVLFDGRFPGWIEEAQGRWYVMQEMQAAAPPLLELRPGSPVSLAGQGPYVVRETNHGSFLSAEGEVPYAAAPGERRAFADLDGAGEAAASIDYGDGRASPRVYLGRVTTFDQLAVKSRGPHAETHVDVRDVKCPNCGAPLPLRAGTKSERVACTYCGALSELGTREVVAKQAAPVQPAIPLGTTGTLEDTTWTIIGYVERSTEDDGETFRWQEYLLYDPSAGYRWLVLDEGRWRFCTPLSAGDVENYEKEIRYQGERYRLRNTGQARVDYVLGEFYWRVEVGETVVATDYGDGRRVVSRESSGDEINWTLGTAVPTSTVAGAFGLEAKALAGPSAGDPRETLSAKGVPPVVLYMIGGAILLVCVGLAWGMTRPSQPVGSAMSPAGLLGGSDDDDSEDGVGGGNGGDLRGGGWFGGMGGK